ncbi:MAG: haloacid dehalogenase type II [Pseudomonadota bacterium]
MHTVFAFDVYGTLINPLGISVVLEKHVGGNASAMAELWRSKQLEYSFRRGLMRSYIPFTDVTRDALNYACLALDIEIDDEIKHDLMRQYLRLESFDDVVPTLKMMVDQEVRLHAFSNGTSSDLNALLSHAGVLGFLESIVSVERIKSFKPDPDVYELFNEITQSQPENTWLVSGNPFDIIGAGACGWKTAWLKRSAAVVFDPWGYRPTKTISSLEDLVHIT